MLVSSGNSSAIRIAFCARRRMKENCLFMQMRLDNRKNATTMDGSSNQEN